jgi:hypothetical protein
MTWEQLHPLTWNLVSGSYRFLVQAHTDRTWVAVMSGPGEHNTILNTAGYHTITGHVLYNSHTILEPQIAFLMRN